MCLTIPGLVKSIDKGIAEISDGDNCHQIDLGVVFDVRPGDWVLYAGKRAVKKITEEDAREIMFLLKDFYHPVDVSKLPLKFKKIVYKVRSGNSLLSLDEVEYLLKLKGKDNLETLSAEANFLRREKIKDFICIHGIIEFSNYCANDCWYCGIRKESKRERFRMTKGEIIKTAYDAIEKGYKLLVLQSGEDAFYSDDDLIEIVKELKKKRVFVFLSVGERSFDFYKKAWDAGATGALIRFETSNADLYASYRPGKRLADRIELIKKMIDIGYHMATGSIYGLPGQTCEDIARDLLLVKELGAQMVSSGPFVPAAGTPLEKDARCKAQDARCKQIQNSNRDKSDIVSLAYKYIAVARFLMPEIKIPVTTALETLDVDGRKKGLLSGANSLMFNLTPEKYAKNYSIYDNKYRGREEIWQRYGLFQDEESWEMLEEKMRI